MMASRGAMTSDELRQAGEALFGLRWQSPMARALGVNDRTVRRWAAGDSPVPDGAAAEIARLLGARRAEQALEEVDRLAAEHGAPAEIHLTQGRDAVGREATRLVAEALRARGMAVEIVAVDEATDDPAERARAAANADLPVRNRKP